MRCELCRDPGYIPKNVEICRDCAPRYYAMEEVADAALAWWATKRPRDFTVAEHVDTPAVNCTTPSEVKTALACAKLAALEVSRG